MSTPVAILITHGMGKNHAKKLKKIKKGLEKQFKKQNIASDSYRIRTFEWNEAIQPRETEYWKTLKKSDYPVRWRALRKFVINSFGDALAYQGRGSKTSDTYYKIHEVFNQNIQQLEAEAGANAPLVVISVSLGSVIMSNYIWDRQNVPSGETDAFGGTAFQRFETLTGFFTLGSNIPLFTMAFDEADVKPFSFPPSQLPDDLKVKARWYNIYDKSDVLGYPLTPTSIHYDNSPIKDKQFNIGGLLTFWNPFNHLKYWSSRKVHKLVASFVKDIISV